LVFLQEMPKRGHTEAGRNHIKGWTMKIASFPPGKHLAGILALIPLMSCSNEMRPQAPQLRQGTGPQDVTTGEASGPNEETADQNAATPPAMTPETPAASNPASPPTMVGATMPTGTLTVSFAPVVPPNSGYPNVFIYAMWITDSTGKYVKTFAAATQSTNRLRYLDKWITASGVALPTQPDGITSATLTYAASPTVNGTWNLKDKAGAAVPAGTYTINIQLASSNAPGPSLQIPINLGTAGDMKTDSTQATGITKVIAKHTP
jgi:hypothetical protein